jgi:drug/metabolite transporter (DMT)-like permease
MRTSADLTEPALSEGSPRMSISSVVFLHERASLLTWAGSLLVVSGLLIVVLSKP